MSAIDELVTELSRLPTIGRKSAMRLTYHLLKQSPDQAQRLSKALGTLHERVRSCERCFNLTEAAVCPVCADPRRDASIICVVEEASDIGAIERTQHFGVTRLTFSVNFQPVGWIMTLCIGLKRRIVPVRQRGAQFRLRRCDATFAIDSRMPAAQHDFRLPIERQQQLRFPGVEHAGPHCVDVANRQHKEHFQPLHRLHDGGEMLDGRRIR